MTTYPLLPSRSDFDMSTLFGDPPFATKQHTSAGPQRGGLHSPTPTPHHGTATSDAPKPRILLVEDNLINQKVAMRMLQQLGYEADVAVNGREALAATHTRTYDIVLMDVQMPVMDGLEATRRLRAELPPEHQPCIIAVTANAMTGDRERCLNSGMDDYVPKPIKLDVLGDAIDRATHRAIAPKTSSDRPSQPGRHSLDAGDSVGPTYRSINS